MNDRVASATSWLEPTVRSGPLTNVAWFAGTWLAVVALGAVKILYPFDGDQALFFLYAEAIDKGARLYVDVWDLKQPGLFWFYWLAGKVFGFSMIGVRAFELLWHAVLAAIVATCLRPYFTHRWLAGVIALASVGSYYMFAGAEEMTQAEMLVALPTLMSAWLLARRYETRGGELIGLVIAGMFGAVTVVFKLPYAPVFVVFVLVSAMRPSGGFYLVRLIRIVVPYAVGVAAVLVPAGLVFYAQGTLDELLWTTFVYPFTALADVTFKAPLGRLPRNVKWFVLCMAPWLVYAGVALPRVLRRDEPLLTRMMLLWMVATIVIILMQPFSFWKYHFLYLFVPAAVLAARGLDLLLTRLTATSPSSSIAPGVLALLFVLPACSGLILRADQEGTDVYRLLASKQQVGLDGYRSFVDHDFGWINEYFTSFREMGGDEPIYVFGSPLIYLLTNRTQAIPIHGWSWEMLPERYWKELPFELEQARPAYVYVARFYRRMVADRSPEVMNFLAENYDLIWQQGRGDLYRLKGLPGPSPEPFDETRTQYPNSPFDEM